MSLRERFRESRGIFEYGGERLDIGLLGLESRELEEVTLVAESTREPTKRSLLILRANLRSQRKDHQYPTADHNHEKKMTNRNSFQTANEAKAVAGVSSCSITTV